ncbi:MAG: hypothetical protein WC824_14770 [Bacteroidota bacterium]
MMRYWEIIEKFDLVPWWGEFLKSNPSLNIPYHNLQHTIYMVEDAYEGAMTEGLVPNENHPLLRAHLLAAIYHDWGHTGGVIHLNPKLRGTETGPGISEAFPDSENIRIALDKVHAMNALGFWPAGVSLDQVFKGIQATEFPYNVPPENLSLSGRILRDADFMTNWRQTMLPHVMCGLAQELGYSLREFLVGRRAFNEGMEACTDWGKRKRTVFLEECFAEIDLNIRALGKIPGA